MKEREAEMELPANLPLPPPPPVKWRSRGRLARAHLWSGEHPMKRNSKGAKRRRTIQVWTLAQAKSAAPYLTSVVRSLREHTLEGLACRRRLRHIEEQIGR